MRSAGLIAAAVFLIISGPVEAQVMARGYYNHVESRVSFYIPSITSADQVTIENINYELRGYEGRTDIPAVRHSYVGPRGTRHAVTSVDFKPQFGAHNSMVQGALAQAATNYRALGEVNYDEFVRTDRIPAHQLNITLPNGNALDVLIILHQDDGLDQRRLIIAEAETMPGGRQPGLFIASIGIINPEFFGTDADHTLWRVRYTPSGPPIAGQELVATQPWGVGVFGEEMSAGGEAVLQ